MIYRDGNELVLRRKGNMVVQAVYKGLRLVWQAVRSCFGSGCWVNDKPWLNDEGWSNG